MTTTGCFTLAAFAVLVAAVGALLDARTGRLPNWLTLGGLMTALVGWFFVGALGGGIKAGAALAGSSSAGALLCALGPAVAFFRGTLGGGDVKLLAALGALLGPRHGMNAELAGFCIGALYVPALLAWRGVLLVTLRGALLVLRNPFLPNSKRIPLPEAMSERVRLGPAIFAGTLLATLFMCAGAGLEGA